jgi:hypothetical protein
MKTDAQTDGRFEFRGVTPGQYILQASGPRPPTNEGEGEFASEELSVTGKEVPNLRIQTSPGAFVQGRLTFDVRLAPPPEGFVFVWEPADGDSAPREAGALHRWRPDRLGRFQMSNITGDRRLNVLTAVPGWRMRTATLNGTEIIDDVVHFDARRRDVNNLTIVMTNGAGDIWGRVVDSRGERVERYSVVVFAVDDRLWYPGSRHLKIGRPAGDGTFDVGGLAAGEYYVAAVDAIRGNDSGGDWQDPDVLKAFESRATRVRVEDDGAVGNVTLDLIVTR